jgi:hypothetical protein
MLNPPFVRTHLQSTLNPYGHFQQHRGASGVKNEFRREIKLFDWCILLSSSV